MYDFKKIKLVIWDLDDTFWNGTISEGEVNVSEENIQLIHHLTDLGVVNSICSKNDYDVVKNKLEELELWELFVFPSINWNPKGGRIKQLISDMNLRPVNVLFIDDNTSNLEEARYFCPEIMTLNVNDILSFYQESMQHSKSDKTHKRLKQYKILEEKQHQKDKFTSNEEFLFDSNIQLVFGYDCQKNIERIFDLVWRSNQLNFTKIRSTKTELMNLFSDESYDTGYVSVNDKFGDYGIVGFYALKDNTLIHFCFSCRTLGMGIEQYVYNKLGRPLLNINGEVISDLSMKELPKWINQKEIITNNTSFETNEEQSHSVLVKGPCDLYQIVPYIKNKDLIDTDFTFVNSEGISIESTGHTTHLVEALRLNDEEKNVVISEVPFADKKIYSDDLYKNKYKLIIMSVLSDANLGVYRRKKTGQLVAFLEGYHPITDRKNWNDYIQGKFYTAGFQFTTEFLESFQEKYEFIGINSPEQILENLTYISHHLPENCILAVLLGGELYYEKNQFPAYENRHIVHKAINDVIRLHANELSIKLIDVNKYLVDQNSFYDHFNHYTKPVYSQLASEIVDIINENTDINTKETSKLVMMKMRLKDEFAPLYYKISNFIHGD